MTPSTEKESKLQGSPPGFNNAFKIYSPQALHPSFNSLPDVNSLRAVARGRSSEIIGDERSSAFKKYEKKSDSNIIQALSISARQ